MCNDSGGSSNSSVSIITSWKEGVSDDGSFHHHFAHTSRLSGIVILQGWETDRL